MKDFNKLSKLLSFLFISLPTGAFAGGTSVPTCESQDIPIVGEIAYKLTVNGEVKDFAEYESIGSEWSVHSSEFGRLFLKLPVAANVKANKLRVEVQEQLKGKKTTKKLASFSVEEPGKQARALIKGADFKDLIAKAKKPYPNTLYFDLKHGKQNVCRHKLHLIWAD